MKRLAALLLLGFVLTGSATAAPVKVHARAWMIQNAATGEVLASHHDAAKMPIASITKLMTVLVTLDHHDLSDVVRVDRRATKVGQETVYLRAGESITIRDLIKAALIQSANDAADALAYSVSPDLPTFAALMNEKGRELGLTDSHFVRPEGLDTPGQVSSARDVTRLALAAMRVPFIRKTVAESDDTLGNGVALHTWNDLLGVVPGIFGVKTGHTDDAGWSQVAAVRAQRVTIYATILGSPSRKQRNRDLETLLEWGLNQYRVVAAISDVRPYVDVELPYGRAPLALVAQSNLLTVARIGLPLDEKVVAPVAISLPVTKGQVLGHVEVWAGSKLIGKRPLVASRSVSKPGARGRVTWYAGRTFRNVLGIFK